MGAEIVMSPMRGLRDRWHALRERLLGSPAFLRWATRFPLTRPIARRRARALFDICAGFVHSQVLAACVELDVFGQLASAPVGAEALARRCDVPPERMRILLDAAVALRLLERRGEGRYGLGPLGAAIRAQPGVAAMVRHHAMLYRDLHDPVALLRDPGRHTELAEYWPYAIRQDADALSAADVAPYSALMAASQPFVTEEVLAAWPFAGHRCVMDIGGGEGGFLIAAARAAPAARLVLFDLPAVVERARVRVAQAGLLPRFEFHAGDFLVDPLPGIADLLTLIRVVHDHDDAGVLRIFRSAHAALPKDGALLVAEPMAATPGAETVADAYFAFYLLAMRRGRPRTPAAIAALLHEAGFSSVRLLRTHTPLLTSAIVARP